MSLSRYILSCFLTTLVLFLQSAKAQTGFELEIKKPEPFDNRVLKSEKTGQKKFTWNRRLFQNTYTHYNYFFNASNRLNEVINQAKAINQDDYANLLPFYNYSLETTAAQKAELDSVIYKAKTGIVMHDLRNDWIDDMYLLWGAAYFLQKEFDSAHQMFQFINYAFAEKEKDGYYKYIGSRLDGSSAQSIVTKEDDKLLKRLTSDPPSRNNAFIWQIRTFIEDTAMADAGSLIDALKKDPNFPERLNASLEEVQAYWFYKQERWDSAAIHLTAALDNAKTKQERARWQYLAGQLFERSGKPEQAKEWFSKSIDNATDPVLDIYARLNLIRVNKEGGDDYVDKNIAELDKMAHRERYADYRDMIYFMMAQMELERNNPDAALKYLEKGAKYSNENIGSRNRTYLKLADLAYSQKKYTAAASYYDSIQFEAGEMPEAETEYINGRKNILDRLVGNLNTIQRQDSLQRIAAMPEAERTDFLKKLARQLRKQQGLKEDETVSSTLAASVTNQSDLFNSNTKGEWYFYNKSSRSNGATTFKQIWGNRPNADNWRRGSSISEEQNAAAPGNTQGVPSAGVGTTTGAVTYDALLQTIPLTQQQLSLSNDSIQNALFSAGNIYFNEIEDYPSAIQAYEELRRRFPNHPEMNEALFHLYYAYQRSGNAAKAEEIKKLLQQKFPESRQASILTSGVDPFSNRPSADVTKTYESIYDMFIEGRFDEAKAAKRIADSIYQTNYWSPQLLYIESVYHIRKNEDSTAKDILNTLIQQNPETPIADKATTLLDVLSRRKQIEEELRNLQIERPQEEVAVISQTTQPIRQAPPTRDTVAVTKTEVPKNNVQNPPEPKKEEVVVPNEPVKKEVVVTQAPPLKADTDVPPLIRDTTAAKPAEIAVAKPTEKIVADTISKKPVAAAKPSAFGFTYDAEAPHFAVVILNKVDNIFGNEAKNAFSRFSKESYVNQVPNVQLLPLDAENKLLLIGIFSNIQQAAEYVQKAKPIASTQIVPWLKADKYTFSVITESNLETLKTNPNLDNYKKFLEQFSKIKW
ncbi:tetratricopeptide repeat protein [Chitinophagaceae bacterium LB-8]|uniref:Tetratricopeptide repeat protein n=1 Tax=Paraflavisolibacter caeni TaxID=2982496 RepID=A0A9X2Y193_9BACT|nr:tetratricopeptide repeat protein [Paraflavisolibacter caeni]MCU7552916.1 tetratricopeptide repeat protein [Paraflavisolibacter caeni]